MMSIIGGKFLTQMLNCITLGLKPSVEEIGVHLSHCYTVIHSYKFSPLFKHSETFNLLADIKIIHLMLFDALNDDKRLIFFVQME